MTGVGTDILMARREAETVMLDRCIIDRRTGETWDDDLGKKVPTYTVLYDDAKTAGRGGKCAVRDGKSVRLSDTGLSIEGLVLAVPVSAVVYRVGDRVRMTASETDPALATSTFTISNLAKGSRLTARRMQITEVP